MNTMLLQTLLNGICTRNGFGYDTRLLVPIKRIKSFHELQDDGFTDIKSFEKFLSEDKENILDKLHHAYQNIKGYTNRRDIFMYLAVPILNIVYGLDFSSLASDGEWAEIEHSPGSIVVNKNRLQQSEGLDDQTVELLHDFFLDLTRELSVVSDNKDYYLERQLNYELIRNVVFNKSQEDKDFNSVGCYSSYGFFSLEDVEYEERHKWLIEYFKKVMSEGNSIDKDSMCEEYIEKFDSCGMYNLIVSAVLDYVYGINLGKTDISAIYIFAGENDFEICEDYLFDITFDKKEFTVSTNSKNYSKEVVELFSNGLETYYVIYNTDEDDEWGFI